MSKKVKGSEIYKPRITLSFNVYCPNCGFIPTCGKDGSNMICDISFDLFPEDLEEIYIGDQRLTDCPKCEDGVFKILYPKNWSNDCSRRT